MLVREIDRKMRLTERMAPASRFTSLQSQNPARHAADATPESIGLGLGLGSEDLNAYSTLRTEPAIQAAVGQHRTLTTVFLTPYVFSGDKLLTAYLRPGDKEACHDFMGSNCPYCR
jgi:hypothetical protein